MYRNAKQYYITPLFFFISKVLADELYRNEHGPYNKDDGLEEMWLRELFYVTYPHDKYHSTKGWVPFYPKKVESQ